MSKQSIAAMFPGPFDAIPAAEFIAENNVSYTRPKGYGYLFSSIQINDSRFESEVIRVHDRTLNCYWMYKGDMVKLREGVK